VRVARVRVPALIAWLEEHFVHGGSAQAVITASSLLNIAVHFESTLVLRAFIRASFRATGASIRITGASIRIF
jgi:hypothetical protein